MRVKQWKSGVPNLMFFDLTKSFRPGSTLKARCDEGIAKLEAELQKKGYPSLKQLMEANILFDTETNPNKSIFQKLFAKESPRRKLFRDDHEHNFSENLKGLCANLKSTLKHYDEMGFIDDSDENGASYLTALGTGLQDIAEYFQPQQSSTTPFLDTLELSFLKMPPETYEALVAGVAKQLRTIEQIDKGRLLTQYLDSFVKDAQGLRQLEIDTQITRLQQALIRAGYPALEDLEEEFPNTGELIANYRKDGKLSEMDFRKLQDELNCVQKCSIPIDSPDQKKSP